MKFDISKSLNGDKIIYIARDSSGAVRFRAANLQDLQKAIKTYKSPPGGDLDLDEKKETPKVGVEKTEEKEPEITSSDKYGAGPENQEATPEESKKKLLKNETKEIVEKKKSKAGKKTFWDSLK